LELPDANPTSWNSAHLSRGCSQSDLQGTGGNGYFYCFAADMPGASTAVQMTTWAKVKDIVQVLFSAE